MHRATDGYLDSLCTYIIGKGEAISVPDAFM